MNKQAVEKVSIWLTSNTDMHKLRCELNPEAAKHIDFTFERKTDSSQNRQPTNNTLPSTAFAQLIF